MRQVVTTLPVLRCRYGLRVLPWMAALALGCSAPPPQPLALRGGLPFELPAPAAPVRLEKNVPREEQIAAGETREYPLSMNAGDYARVTVDQARADVALRLIDPSGRKVAEADGPGGRKAPEQLSWTAAAAGEYRLEVAAKEAGRTKVTLEDLRPSQPGDAERLSAERGSWEAAHWLSLEDEAWKRKALARYEEVLALWERADVPQEEIATLNQIGALHRGFGDADKALALYERALALALRTENRRGEAQTRQSLGVAHLQQGKYPLANQDLTEAVRLWEALGDSAELPVALYSLGFVQYAEGDPETAFASLERALKLRRDAGELKTQAVILIMMGTIYRDRGEGDRALEIGREALEISRSTQDRGSEANALQMMAGTYLRRGELQQALELYTSALQAQRLVGSRSSVAWALSALGATTLALGDVDRALDYYTQALEIQTEIRSSAWQAYTLRDLGWVFDRKGQPEKALEYYTRALEISRQVKDRRNEALCLHGIGQARIALGGARDAVPILEQAIALYREADNASGEINGILELGHAWQVLGDPDQASRLYEQGLDLSRQRKALLSEAVAQSAIAGVEKDRGQLQEAAAAVEESLRIIESIRPKVASQRQRVSFFASRRESYDVYIDLQMRMHEQDPDGGHLTRALAASERARARALLDLLAEGRIDVRKGISSDLKQHEIEAGNRVSLLQSQLLDLLQGGKSIDRIEQELDQAEDERDRIEGQIRAEHPRYAAVSNPAPLQPRSIQELLDGRTAFLEYAVGKEASYLFVVTRDRMEGYRLPPERELADRVETVREALREPGRRQLGRYADAARRLYRDLLGPAEEVLRDRPKLIVAPDGPLLLLSFEALLTGPGGSSFDDLPYLVRERSVTYVPSASVFAELGAPGAPAPTSGPGLFVGFGDPLYEPAPAAGPDRTGTENAWGFQTPGLTSPRRLPESRREVLGIAGLFPRDSVRLYLDGDASEKNVRDNPLLKQARWIHFAVHGFVNEERPEYSGLLLARDDDPADNGLLQAYEIFNLELTADLVVLSACDTALGKNVSGEGLIGVSRALLYAGAASVVVSLWQVSDTSASDLMIRFYRHLSEGKEKSEALRLSKLEMIREGKSHPYHWAAFTLIGQPGPAVTPGQLARQ